MARISYVSRQTIPDGRTDLYDRLIAERGPNPENIFLALANAPALTEAVLGMATALRKQTSLPKVFRELAVVTVGIVANAPYEVDHHWNAVAIPRTASVSAGAFASAKKMFSGLG